MNVSQPFPHYHHPTMGRFLDIFSHTPPVKFYYQRYSDDIFMYCGPLEGHTPLKYLTLCHPTSKNQFLPPRGQISTDENEFPKWIRPKVVLGGLINTP